MAIPDIDLIPRHPILQALASKDSWVKVDFFGKEPPTKAEIFKTIEMLCMMHNGWDDEPQQPTLRKGGGE
jgi:hypothetical protein